MYHKVQFLVLYYFSYNKNDIALSNKLFDFILYADDTSLSTTLEIISKIII